MKSVFRWCVVPLLAGTLVAQTAAKPKPRRVVKASPPAVTLQDIQSLKDALAAQQQQIEQLKQEVQQKDQAWQQAQQQLQQAQSTASDAQSKATSAEAEASGWRESVVRAGWPDGGCSDHVDQHRLLAPRKSRSACRLLESSSAAPVHWRRPGSRGEFLPGPARPVRTAIVPAFGCAFRFEGPFQRAIRRRIALATGSFGDPTTTTSVSPTSSIVRNHRFGSRLHYL